MTMRAVAFEGCAGWLHPAGGGRGAVLVPAHGFEGLCSRHALRCLADTLARSGIPTLRFDLRGTGDSSGTEDDIDLVAAWTADIAAAVRRLRAETGVPEVALIGMRLGALLALKAAASLSEVTHLALLAPPGSGAAFLREMRALSQILGAEPGEVPGEHAVAGWRIPAALASDLKALDPATVTSPPAANVLVLAPEAARGALRLAEHLSEVGCAVTREPFAGYQELICDPTASQVPQAALDRVAAWAAAGVVTGAAPVGASSRIDSDERLEQKGWSERGVLVGARGAAGIACRPRATARPMNVVLFLNAGGINHVGWARMNVEMARRLAGFGIASLRLDFPGTGDAEPWRGAKRMTFYDPGTRDHVVAAIDWLADQGATSITVVGTCSGAHHAFHAARDDRRVTGLVLLNMLCFIWGPGYAVPLNAWKVSRPREMAGRQRDLAGGAGASGWIERLVDRVLPIAKRHAKRTMEAAKTVLAPVIQRLQGGGRNAVAGWFRALSQRGARVALVYGETDAGRVELERYMGPGGERATILQGVSLRLIPETDHALTPAAARARYSDIVLAFARGDGEPDAEARSFAFRSAAE